MDIFGRKEALEQADRILGSRNTGSRWKTITGAQSMDEMRRAVFNETVADLWDSLMYICGAYCGAGRTHLNPEKAIAELVRRGLRRDRIDLSRYPKIRFRTDRFIYTILKGYRCFTIYPGKAPAAAFKHIEAYEECRCMLTAEEFADFVYAFDSLIPELERKTDAYVLEVKAKEMQKEIAERSIAAYEEEFLSPSGISYEVKGVSEDSVTVIFFGRFGYEDMETEIPLDSLSAVLPQIPSRMVPVKEEENGKRGADILRRLKALTALSSRCPQPAVKKINMK